MFWSSFSPRKVTFKCKHIENSFLGWCPSRFMESQKKQGTCLIKCVCVCERERESERECECVWERERERNVCSPLVTFKNNVARLSLALKKKKKYIKYFYLLAFSIFTSSLFSLSIYISIFMFFPKLWRLFPRNQQFFVWVQILDFLLGNFFPKQIERRRPFQYFLSNYVTGLSTAKVWLCFIGTFCGPLETFSLIGNTKATKIGY